MLLMSLLSEPLFFEVVRICITVIDIITEQIIVADITVFVSINVVDVVRMFIIFFVLVRVCIMTNNQLTNISSQSENFVVVRIKFLL